MKIITLYPAVDGTNWPTEAEALTRDALCAHVDEALALLRPRPNTIEFDNGATFVQQDSALWLPAKQRIVDLAYAITDHKVFANIAEDIHPMSVAGRILSDMGGPLNAAWWRFSCIDSQFREWGQPYFVNHPNPDATAL